MKNARLDNPGGPFWRMKMKRIMILVAAMLVAGWASATTVYTNAYGHVVTVAADGTATIVVPAGNAAAVAYGATFNQTVTNGQAVALIPDVINVLVSVGSTNNGANTITIVNPAASAVGKDIVVAVSTGSTNTVALARDGNYWGPAKTLAAGQKMDISVGATNVLYGP